MPLRDKQNTTRPFGQCLMKPKISIIFMYFPRNFPKDCFSNLKSSGKLVEDVCIKVEIEHK
jgi:hypothetical protein